MGKISLLVLFARLWGRASDQHWDGTDLTLTIYKAACTKPCSNQWAWKRSKITASLVTFWALLIKRAVMYIWLNGTLQPQSSRKPLSHHPICHSWAALNPSVPCLHELELIERTDPIYEGHATHNIQNTEGCNHSLLSQCAHFPTDSVGCGSRSFCTRCKPGWKCELLWKKMCTWTISWFFL